MHSQTRNILQEVYILATGTVANSAEMAAYEGMVAASGDYSAIAALVDNYMGTLAGQIGVAAVVQAVAQNGFGLTLDSVQTQNIITSLTSQGVDSWSKLFTYCVNLQGSEGATLINRAEASNTFLDYLEAANKGAYYAGNGVNSTVKALLQNVDSTAASLTNANHSFDTLVTKLSASGARSSIVDGYVNSAVVFADANGDGIWNQGEAATYTASNGDFFLNGGTGNLIASGGTDIATGSALNGHYSAPAGSTVISPLTTLAQSVAAANHISTAQAETLVKTKLGLDSSVDLHNYNPIVEATASGASAATRAIALKVESVAAQVSVLMGQIGALLHGASATVDNNVGADAASQALASLIAGADVSVDLGNSSTIKQIIQISVASVGASASQAAAINTLATDAAQVIANLNSTIQVTVVNNSANTGKTTLIEIAKVQVAGETIESLMESGAGSQDLRSAKDGSTGEALTAAIAAAAYTVGDVDGDTLSDATPSSTSKTMTLTTGVDSGAKFVGGSGDDIFEANSVGAYGAFGLLDNIDGGNGNDVLYVVDSNSINISAGGVFVKNVETINVTDAATVKLDATAFTGLTTLNILASNGADAITAAATTAVSVVDTAEGGVVVTGGSTQTVSAVGAVTLSGAAGTVRITETGNGQLASAIVVDGGTTVTVTSTHNQGGLITVGATKAPTAAVVVATSVDAAQTGGLITINGGTTVTVTESAAHAEGTSVTAESAVTINGGAATTDVSVTQAAVAAAAFAVTGVTGVRAVSAVVAAPGTQAVAGVTAVAAVAAVTGCAGIAADGAVVITDTHYNTALANTINSVTLNNYGASSAIKGNVLRSLFLSGTGGTLAITNATNGAGAVPAENTTLALAVNGLSGNNTVTDTNNEISILNVTAIGADSTLAGFADTGLTTLTVAGDKVFRLNTINSTLTSIAVSGAAGFNDGGTTAANGFAARGGAATFTTTSTGAINLSIDATTQTFAGASGVDTIRISSLTDATKVITGGSSNSDELILEGGPYALTAATGFKVTSFETLGVAANVTGTIDMSNLAAGFNTFHIIGNSTITFTKAAANASLLVDNASTLVAVGYADSNGSADTISVTLGTAASDSVNFGTLVLKDAANVGIGTVNLVSKGVDITAGDAIANFNTVVLTDNGLSVLNVSGTQGLNITTINEASTQAASFTLNNTNSGSSGVTIGTLTDTLLTALNFTGTGSSTITTLTDASSTTLSISNTGSQLAKIGTFTSTANLTSFTLSDKVQIGDGLVGGTGLTATSTAGVTVSGAADNAHVKLTLAGAAVGWADNITLGNGNNVVTDVSTAGTVNVTVGTGSNFLTIGGATTNTTGAYNINLGAHTAATGSDYITVGTGGTAYATATNYVISGAVTGDRIIFAADGASSAAALSATAAGGNLALTITAIETAASAAHGVAYAVFGSNTYIAESVSGVLAGTDTTLVELVGTHTLAASAGYVTLAS